MDAEADGEGHALALADGAARHRRLLVDMACGVVVVVLLFPVDDHLTGGHLLRGVHLVLGHAAEIAQHDVGAVGHDVAGIVQDGPAQGRTGQRKGRRDAQQYRHKAAALLLFRLSLGAGGVRRRSLRGSADAAFLRHGVIHHLFRFFLYILILERDGGVLHVGVQRFQHLCGAGIPVDRQLRHGALRDLDEAQRHLRGKLGQRLRGVPDLLAGHLHHVVGVEGQPAREHLVHHDAHGVDVALGVGLLPLRLFGADVVDAAHGLFAVLDLVLGPGDAGDAKVHHPQLAVVQQHDVLGLDVPVDDAVAVGVVEGAEDLGDEVDGLPAGYFAAPLVEVLPEGHALHALHHDIL